MKKKTRNWILLLIGIVVLLLIASKMLGSKKLTEVDITTVELRNITEVVAANGKIEPEVEVKISAEVSGEIVELPVIEGQQVEKGQLLAVINPELIKAASDQANAALNQSKANLANTKARLAQSQANFTNSELNYNRSKQLHDKKAISDAEFDNAKAQFETAKAELEAAKQSVLAAEFNVQSLEASLKQARENLGRTRIYSPMSGTISKMNVKLGERVVGTAQMSGTELMRVADLSVMVVNASVNENDIVRVHLQDTALIEVDAYPKKKFKGIVFQIANSAAGSTSAVGNNADQVTNFEVKIRILSSSYADLADEKNVSPFRPGMSSAVEIQTKKVFNVLSVPIQAVTPRKAEGVNADSSATEKSDGNEYVFIFKNGKAEQVVVETGIQDNDYIQITKGLEKGQEIIWGPYSAISKTLKNQEEVRRKENKK
jgi:HlyD family secretion protein